LLLLLYISELEHESKFLFTTPSDFLHPERSSSPSPSPSYNVSDVVSDVISPTAESPSRINLIAKNLKALNDMKAYYESEIRNLNTNLSAQVESINKYQQDEKRLYDRIRMLTEDHMK